MCIKILRIDPLIGMGKMFVDVTLVVYLKAYPIKLNIFKNDLLESCKDTGNFFFPQAIKKFKQQKKKYSGHFLLHSFKSHNF